MSLYQLKTFEDLYTAVREELRLASNDTARINAIKRDINITYGEVVAANRWWWLKGYAQVTRDAYVSTGTAAVTTGAATVTLTTAPGYSVKNYFFTIDGYNEVYTVESHTAASTTLKLSSIYTGTTVTAATYRLWTNKVALPADCKETLVVRHDHYSTEMQACGVMEFRRVEGKSRKTEGYPAYYHTGDFIDPQPTSSITSLPALTSRASSGMVKTLVFAGTLPSATITAVSAGEPVRWVVSSAGHPGYNGEIIISAISTTTNTNDTLTYTGFAPYQESATSDSSLTVTALNTEAEYKRYRELSVYPSLYSSRVTLHVDYQKEPAPLNNDEDEPAMPESDRSVLLYGALQRAWSRERNPEEAARNQALYENKLAKMEGKLQDGFDKPKLSPSKLYLGQKRSTSRGRAVDLSANNFGGGGAQGAPVITGTPATVATFDSGGVLTGSATISTTELGYINGVTSQLSGNSDTATYTNKSISGLTNTITNVSLTAGVTGTLPIANGGTGQTTAAAAITALLPSQTSNTYKILQTNGSTASWVSDPIFNVKWYGAVADGVTDDTTAFNSAITAANSAGGGRIHVPAGTYAVLSIAMKSNVALELAPGAILLKTGGSSSTYAINFTGSLSATTTTLSGNAAIGDRTLAVTSETGFAAGDWLLVRDSVYVSGTTGRNQEIVRVASTSAGSLALTGSLIGSYATASSAAVYKLTAIENAKIMGKGQVKLASGTAGGGISLDYCVNCGVEGITILGPNQLAGVVVAESTEVTIDGIVVRDGQTQTSGLGYGVSIGTSSHHVLISNSHFENIRENPISARSRFVTFVNNTCIDANDSAVNTHGQGCSDIVISGNVISGGTVGVAVGFSGHLGGDKRVIISNNVIRATRSEGISVAADNTTENQDIVITGNNISRFATVGSTKDGILVSECIGAIVSNNYIDGESQANINAGIFAVNSDYVDIYGNSVEGSPSYGIYVNTCTYSNVARNSIRGITSNNVRTLGTNTAVYVVNNIADDATVSIGGTGVTSYGNSWDALPAASVGTIDTQSAVADGAVLSSGVLYMQSADATHPGLINTGTQTVAGAKTWSGAATFSSTVSAAGGVVTVSNATAGAPSVCFTGSTTTGIYRSAANTFGIATNGVQKMTLTEWASGSGAFFVVGNGAANEINGIANNVSSAAFYLMGGTGTSSGGQVRIYAASHASKASKVEITNGNTVEAVWDSSGNLVNTGSVTATAGFKFNTVAAKTTTYTATTSDWFIPCDTTSAGFTLTLPAVSGNSGLSYIIKKISSDANVLTIDANASETIDGALTATLSVQYEAIQIFCNGSVWYIV